MTGPRTLSVQTAGRLSGPPTSTNMSIAKIPFDPNIPGIYADVPAQTYHDATHVLSSTMTDLLDPPAELKGYLDAEEEMDPTEYMLMGSFVHQRILEPSSPLPKLVVPPEKYPVPADSSLVKTKKAAVGDMVPWHGGAGYCKAWKQNHEAAGKIVVTAAFLEKTACCVEAIRKDPDCQQIFKSGVGELSVIAPADTARGQIMCRCRLDWLPTAGNSIVDIKKVSKGMAHPRGIYKLITDRRWHVKAVHYLQCWNYHMGTTDPRTKFVFVLVEDTYPYLTACYYLPIELMEIGLRELVSNYEVYAACKADNKWPGYGQGIMKVEVPQKVLEREGLA